MLNSALGNVNYELKNMEKLAYLYQTEPRNFPDLSAKELEKRVEKVQEARDKLEMSVKKVRMILGSAQNSSGNDLEEKPLVAGQAKRGEDGEFEDTKAMGNRQVLDKQKLMLRNQD